MTQTDATDPITLLAVAWQEAGKRAPLAVTANQTRCLIPDCTAMAWVQLKTYHGPIAICFKHFQAVQEAEY